MMNELIRITEREDGSKAVSARELHQFLESKRDFSNWIKDRIEKYDLTENVDYVVYNNFGENPKGGRPLTEYALSVDAAKELSMVEGNDKGKQARKYFIECERIAKEKSKPLSQIEILVQSAQMLLEQERRISSVENKLERIEQERKEATTNLLSAPISTEPLPELSLRNNIRQLVNKYSNSTGINQRDVWHKIYRQLYYLYNININAYKVQCKETKLDVAERNLFLDKMFIVISNMIQELK